MHAAAFFDGDGWHDGVVELRDGRMLLREESPARDLPRLDGVIVGGFTDHHVHLQLVDHALLHTSTIGRVVDLGASPTVIADLAATMSMVRVNVAAPSGVEDVPADRGAVENAPESAQSGAFLTPHAVAVDFAGAFLTPVGGYPSDRDWAPAGSFREIADVAAAERAIAEMADAGASCIKVANNSTAGPVFDDDLLRAITEAARSYRLPVIAHAEGPGQAQRAARLGAALLAHTPFTERLDDASIATQAASVSWISTLAIHDGGALSTAIDNVRRFHAAGGTVLYGTDMGNGPTPVDLNTAELDALRAAGLADTDLLRALAPQDPRDPTSLLLLLPGPDADPGPGPGPDPDPTLARPLTSADLKA
jgi:hypothetical protein